MPEEPSAQQDQVWKYKDLVDKYSQKPEVPDGSEKDRTIVGLNAVTGKGENPYLPIPPEPEKKPTAGMDGRFDYMPP